MTIYADLGTEHPPSPRAPRPRRRYPWLLITASIVVLLLLLGGWYGWSQYAKHYQPLGLPHSGYGWGSSDKSLKGLDDGAGSTRYALTGPAGTTGTLTFALANNGRFDVRLLAGPNGRDYYTRAILRWVPIDKRGTLLNNDGTQAKTDFGYLLPGNGAQPDRWRPFPMTLHAHQAIQLFLTVTQPDCRSAQRTDVDSVPLLWSALGHRHIYEYPLVMGNRHNAMPIVICPHPSKAS